MHSSGSTNQYRETLMPSLLNYSFVLLSLVLVNVTRAETHFELSGKLQLEGNVFFDEGQFEGQDYQYNLSLAAKPEFYWRWNDGRDSFIATPFYRYDQRDDERRHGDLREFAWIHVANNWEFRTGVRKVFWGVTEFVHLVDIINQSDSIESLDNEEKLGQPMINISYVSDWGIFDAFVLTGFRERTFPGEDGRLRPQLMVDTDNPSYESNDEEKHIDYAFRWAHTFGIIDFGLYWFDGTDRNPILQPVFTDGNPRVVPHYQQITQVGTDIQATIDSWLLKFEGIYQDNKQEEFFASQLGFEYTLYGLGSSALDLGLLLEYGWDERGTEANTFSQNDIYSGARLTFNDAADTTVLMGVSYDADFYSRSLLIEASRRINDRWTAELELLAFDAGDSNDTVYSLDKDDRVLLSVERYF